MHLCTEMLEIKFNIKLTVSVSKISFNMNEFLCMLGSSQKMALVNDTALDNIIYN